MTDAKRIEVNVSGDIDDEERYEVVVQDPLYDDDPHALQITIQAFSGSYMTLTFGDEEARTFVAEISKRWQLERGPA